MRTLLAHALVGLCLAGCAYRSVSVGPGEPPPGPTPEKLRLERLASWMTGTFDNAMQAADRPEDFFLIRLVMVPIWTERDDGPWLYVEQAAASALERPYRQRIYRLRTGEGRELLSEVYTLPGDPLAFAGAWESPERLAELRPEQLDLRDGCTIHLVEDPSGRFVGSTLGSGCASTLRGATYATSEVTVIDGVLESLDRGFDDEGRQVWGSEHGPYRFVRLAKGAPPR